jgi:hypothetical protein
MTKITLPNEILDIILNHYWQFKFKDVLHELVQPYIIEQNIINFIKNYCFKKDLFHKKYLNYYIYCNNKIKDLKKNKINLLICKLNNLKLKFCFSENSLQVFNHIHQDLIYIMLFSITNSNYYRFLVYHEFCKLSNQLNQYPY